ncbi:hypothetical protein GQ457_12G008900 [Hibiscus cannabinus]
MGNPDTVRALGHYVALKDPAVIFICETRLKEIGLKGRRVSSILLGVSSMESDANAILECPINPIREDLQVWGPHSLGVYSVKSGYKWISSLQSSQEDRSILWRTIAALPALPKIRLFAWRLCYEAFPLGRKLAAAGLATGLCCLCQESMETGLHAFRYCPAIKEAFDLCDLTRIIVDYAQLLSSDFLEAQEMASNSAGSNSQDHWLRGLHTAASAEACAFKEGVRMAIENDWTQVVFEGDSATVVSKLDRRDLDRSHTAAHLRSTISKLVDHPGFSFSFVRRALNRAAHGSPMGGEYRYPRHEYRYPLHQKDSNGWKMFPTAPNNSQRSPMARYTIGTIKQASKHKEKTNASLYNINMIKDCLRA